MNIVQPLLHNVHVIELVVRVFDAYIVWFMLRCACNSCVLSLDQANTLCTSVFESVKMQLSSKSLTLLEQRQSTLQSSVSQTMKDQLINTNRLSSLYITTFLHFSN